MSNAMGNKKQKTLTSSWLPILGFILAICFGAIAWIFSPDLLDWADSQFSGFDGNEMNPETLRIVFAGFIFFTLSSITSLIVAVTLPKKKSRVREKDLQKEREEIAKEKRRRKKRQLEMAKAAKRQNRKKNQ